MRTPLFMMTFAAVVASLAAGCASVGESGSSDDVTAHVGKYAPPPSGVEQPRVGVPPFSIGTSGGYNFDFARDDLEDIAADQMTTLLYRSDRFKVIERAQLQQLLAEQDLEGIVRPGELARMGDVRGVDYLLIGKVTNFRIKFDRQSREAGVGGKIARDVLGGWGGAAEESVTNITTDLGVDIRLVDPSTGEVEVAHFSDYSKTDSASSMGINIAGVGASGDADVRIGRDDAGKVLRLAFDDALRKMLPEVDAMLVAQRRGGGAPMAADGGSSSDTDTTDAATPSFCSSCGEKLASGAKFCPACGQKVQ